MDLIEQDTDIVQANVEWGAVDLKITGLTSENVEQVSSTIGRIASASQFWVGDYLLECERVFGDHAEQYAPPGIPSGSLVKWRWVCQRIPPGIRRRNLTYSHHEEVAKLDEDQDISGWLETADREGWSVADLRKAIKEFMGKEAKKKVRVCPECGAEFVDGEK